jgi:CRP-like cAMP-binding protein
MSKDLADQLGELPLFSSLARAPREAIAQVSELQKASRGEILIREDEVATRGFFVLLEGQAPGWPSPVPRVAKRSSPSWKKAISSGRCPFSTAIPVPPRCAPPTDVRLLLVRRQTFLDLLRRFPEIAIGLMTELSGRFRHANRKISALALSPVYARVSGALLQLAELRGFRVRDRS